MPQPTQIDELTQIAVSCCSQCNPETIDEIFDSLPVELNEQMLV